MSIWSSFTTGTMLFTRRVRSRTANHTPRSTVLIKPSIGLSARRRNCLNSLTAAIYEHISLQDLGSNTNCPLFLYTGSAVIWEGCTGAALNANMLPVLFDARGSCSHPSLEKLLSASRWTIYVYALNKSKLIINSVIQILGQIIYHQDLNAQAPWIYYLIALTISW